jgi:sugar lactone lactonase YvrE
VAFPAFIGNRNFSPSINKIFMLKQLRLLSVSVGLLLPFLGIAQQRGPLATSTRVTTLAGTAGHKGSTDGAGAIAQFNFPHSLVVDSNGTVYVADMDNHTVRKITAVGVVTTLAGVAGQSGSLDGTGAAARFKSPAGIALDASGTLYVTDAANHTVRKISPAGVVTTLAGTPGQKGTADGPGPAARFNAPHAVVVDAAGIVYVADTYNHTIRKIMPTGAVTTLAGQPGQKGGTDGAGPAARFRHPSGLALDAERTLYVADNGNHTIRKVTATGLVSTLAGQAGHKGSADGPGAVARFDVPGGVAVDASGMVYVADYFNSTIRQITPLGEVTTFAGMPRFWRSLDGPRADARFEFPFGVAVGPGGWLYVAESGSNTIRVIK